MSTSTTTTATTPYVAQHATHVDALDLTQTQLIGLFGGTDETRAMLRAPDGSIITARMGETTTVGTLTLIAEIYVLLREGRNIRRLTLPA